MNSTKTMSISLNLAPHLLCPLLSFFLYLKFTFLEYLPMPSKPTNQIQALVQFPLSLKGKLSVASLHIFQGILILSLSNF